TDGGYVLKSVVTMDTLVRFTAPASPCGYLPHQRWSLEYEYVARMSAPEYMQRMTAGWRRFGHVMFRPRCRSCQACQPIRVVADRFRPSRSQRRAGKASAGIIELRI